MENTNILLDIIQSITLVITLIGGLIGVVITFLSSTFELLVVAFAAFTAILGVIASLVPSILYPYLLAFMIISLIKSFL